MKRLMVIVLVCTLTDIFAQVEISGIISDVKGSPIPGANIYFEGTYDGTTSGVNGDYVLNQLNRSTVLTFIASSKGNIVMAGCMNCHKK